MEEQIISFETAKLLKDKNFDFIDVHSYYHVCNKYTAGYVLCYGEVNEQTVECLLAPTQSLLQRWLREEHNIFVWVSYDQYMDIKFNTHIKDLSQINSFTVGYKETYELAMEKVLFKALELIK